MTSDSSKNITKYESYKYAFERLQAALEHEFFLEAVMIAESIVADRLLSYLTLRLQESESDKTLNPGAALQQLIDQWEGKQLARDLCSWTQSQKTKLRKFT